MTLHTPKQVSADELLACPFCQGEAYAHEDVGLGPHWVVCDKCGAEGPYRDSHAEAITAWNTRRSSAGVKVTDEMVERALEALVPGGSEVWHWIGGGGREYTSIQINVMRAALAAALALPSHAGEDDGAVAWRHKLTGIIRQDRPAVAMGLVEDYDALYLRPSPSVPPQGEVAARRIIAGIKNSLRLLNDEIPRIPTKPDPVVQNNVGYHAAQIGEQLDRALSALTPSPTLEPSVVDALKYAAKGLDMIHNGLMDPTRPRQSVGEVCAHFLEAANKIIAPRQPTSGERE